MNNRIDDILALIDDALEAPEPWCPHGTDPTCNCLEVDDDEDPTAGFIYPLDR